MVEENTRGDVCHGRAEVSGGIGFVFDFQGCVRCWRRIGVGLRWWWDFIELLIKNRAIGPIGLFRSRGLRGWRGGRVSIIMLGIRSCGFDFYFDTVFSSGDVFDGSSLSCVVR